MPFKPGDYALTFASKQPSNNMRVVRLIEFVGDTDPLLAVGAEWDNPKRVRAWVVAPEQGTLLDRDNVEYREIPWDEKRLIPLEGPGDPTISSVTRRRDIIGLV